MANLFDKVKASGTKKATEKHEVVNVPSLKKSLSRMSEIDTTLAELEAERTTLDSEVKATGKSEMIKLYNQKNSFPGTIKLQAGDMSCQFITSDKYIKIDADRMNELNDKYKGIAVEGTTYTFKPELLEKYADVLSDLILNCKEIADEDKPNLIESSTAYSVAKGTIKNLRANYPKNEVEEIVEDIRPVFSLKSIQKDA